MTTNNRIALRTKAGNFELLLPEGTELKTGEDYSLVLGGYEATLTVTGGYQARTGLVIQAAMVVGIRGEMSFAQVVLTKASGSTGERYLQARR